MTAEVLRWPRHVRAACSCNRENPYCPGCHLFVCSVCNAAEGELATECPGYRTHPDEHAAVLNGHIDFRGGRWVALEVDTMK